MSSFAGLTGLAHPDRTVRVSDGRIVGLIPAAAAVGSCTPCRSLRPRLGSASPGAVLLGGPVAAIGWLLVAAGTTSRTASVLSEPRSGSSERYEEEADRDEGRD